MSKELSKVRGIIRSDLDSVGLIPTAMGVQVAAAENPALAYALQCEAVYVRLFNDRDFYDILHYLETSMRLPPENARRILSTAVHARDVLAAYRGDRRKAVEAMVHERNADPATVSEVVETAFRVSEEYKVGWERNFGGEDEYTKRRKRLKTRALVLGVAGILVGVAGVAVWLAVRFLAK